jgi:hypothetical protein
MSPTQTTPLQSTQKGDQISTLTLTKEVVNDPSLDYKTIVVRTVKTNRNKTELTTNEPNPSYQTNNLCQKPTHTLRVDSSSSRDVKAIVPHTIDNSSEDSRLSEEVTLSLPTLS